VGAAQGSAAVDGGGHADVSREAALLCGDVRVWRETGGLEAQGIAEYRVRHGKLGLRLASWFG
jgi:hypothetical protein